ncbi:MAG: DUF3168 domain-containing protein [Ramlibacter sp.]
MSLESDLLALLGSSFAGRLFPDVAPANTTRPYGTWQQVGGESVTFVEAAKASKKNARIQINVWGITRLEANAKARAIEDLMVANAPLQATALGAFTAVYEEDTKLYGTRQDFSVWFTD